MNLLEILFKEEINPTSLIFTVFLLPWNILLYFTNGHTSLEEIIGLLIE